MMIQWSSDTRQNVSEGKFSQFSENPINNLINCLSTSWRAAKAGNEFRPSVLNFLNWNVKETSNFIWILPFSNKPIQIGQTSSSLTESGVA
jgi:hypothetical protein